MFLFSIVAFLGGILSVLSPCSGALLPTYFAITFKSKEKLLANTLFFSLGVLLVSIPIGLGSYFIFYILSVWGKVLFNVLGVVFFLMGFLTLFDIKLIKLPDNSSSNSKKGYFGSIMFGIISAFSLGACSGPILGAIATLAASTKSYLSSTILMLFYTSGILLPFIAISFGLDRTMLLKKLFVQGKSFSITLFEREFYMHSSNIISATIFIFVGIIFMFNNGSLLNAEKLLNINVDAMLQWQDSLLEILN